MSGYARRYATIPTLAGSPVPVLNLGWTVMDLLTLSHMHDPVQKQVYVFIRVMIGIHLHSLAMTTFIVKHKIKMTARKSLAYSSQPAFTYITAMC